MILQPQYRFFNERLVLLKLSDIYDRHPVNTTHMHKVRKSIHKVGLLLPMVVDHKKHIMSGSHRLKVIREMGQHRQSLFYVARTPEEIKFFDALCKAVYQQHKLGQVDPNLQFMFEGKNLAFTQKVLYLFEIPKTK